MFDLSKIFGLSKDVALHNTYQRPYFPFFTSPYHVTIVMVLLNTYGTHKAHFLVDPCVCVRALASNLCVLFLMTKNMIIMKDTLFKESLRGKCN